MNRKSIVIGSLALVLALLLALVPACGDDEEGKPEVTPTPAVTPTPGGTPAPGVTPTPTPEAKTLKIGWYGPLSGPAAPWGVNMELATRWAADRINEGGGVKVGADTYMIKVVTCDSQFTGSGAMECASLFAYDEKVDYVVGLGANDAIKMTFHQEKILFGCVTMDRVTLSPDLPYLFTCWADGAEYLHAFMDGAMNLYPEITSMATIYSVSPQYESQIEIPLETWCEANGVEWVVAEFYEAGTTDFYPILTKVVSKDPDCLHMPMGAPGVVRLIIKQARELGYTNPILVSATLAEVLGRLPGEMIEGIVSCQPDWVSPDFPEGARELYRDFNERYPEMGGYMDYSIPLEFASVQLYAAAVEQAGSLDPDAVIEVIYSPDFRFNFFGFDSEMTGTVTHGFPGQANGFNVVSIIEDGVNVTRFVNRLPTP